MSNCTHLYITYIFFENKMSKYFLIECTTDVNRIIKQPLQQTQRIKFTSFDVSANYISFGASSGGIYVFKRNPCEFLKLVPSKEGAVSHIAISPDEKVIAISSSRGLVILVENCFTDTNIQYQIYTEHKGNNITALKWQPNELYCGDSLGKVSVISLTSILSKAIFQPPSATLMQLGSYIVQLDVYSNFLLVSTRTKTFLCDTKEEQYRQIGKKLRDGDFGACFYTENPPQCMEVREKEKSIFKILKEGEQFSGPKLEGVKIFCTRPGLRMWEASFEASVVCTYQFRESASQASSKVIQLGREESCRLKMLRCSPIKGIVNFGRISVVTNKFLLTFISSNLFIFDAQGVNLLYRYSLVDYVKDVKIIDNYIYIWDKSDVKVLMLLDLEKLLMKLLVNKQYYLCAEICIKHSKELYDLLRTSHKVQALNILREKLIESDISVKLEPILAQIKDGKMNQNGIITVENGHVIEAACSHEYVTEKSKSLKSMSNNRTQIKGRFSKNESEPNLNPEITEIMDPIQDPNYMLNILYKQYQVNKMYNNIEMPQIYELLSVKNLEEIVVIFKDFISHVKEINSEDNKVEQWCYVQYLKYINKFHPIKDLCIDSVALEYIFDAFKSINTNYIKLLCDCTFPLPNINKFKAEYYDIGCELSKRLSDTELRNFQKTVPYMWKHHITEHSETIGPVLPLIVQFSDASLLHHMCEKFSCDHWEDAFCMLVKLKKKICLNCEKRIEFDVAHTIPWRDFCTIAVKSVGAAATIKLMHRYSKFIPNHELGAEFYQTCVFSAVTNERDKADKVMDVIFSDSDLSNKFDESLSKYLNSRYLGSSSSKESTKSNSKCSSCALPLKTPILCSDVRLSCNHYFHKMCLESLKNICCICDVQQK